MRLPAAVTVGRTATPSFARRRFRARRALPDGSSGVGGVCGGVGVDPVEKTAAMSAHDCNDHMVELDDGYGWDCSVCWDRGRINVEYVKACIRVAALARLFVATTDVDPLVGLTFDQGVHWDALADAIVALEELETVA